MASMDLSGTHERYLRFLLQSTRANGPKMLNNSPETAIPALCQDPVAIILSTNYSISNKLPPLRLIGLNSVSMGLKSSFSYQKIRKTDSRLLYYLTKDKSCPDKVSFQSQFVSGFFCYFTLYDPGRSNHGVRHLMLLPHTTQKFFYFKLILAYCGSVLKAFF